jgi:hypothetical protein
VAATGSGTPAGSWVLGAGAGLLPHHPITMHQTLNSHSHSLTLTSNARCVRTRRVAAIQVPLAAAQARPGSAGATGPTYLQGNSDDGGGGKHPHEHPPQAVAGHQVRSSQQDMLQHGHKLWWWAAFQLGHHRPSSVDARSGKCR